MPGCVLTSRQTNPSSPLHAVVVTKIRTAHTPTPERLMRQDSQSSDFLVNIWFKRRRKQVLGASGSVFCFVVVEFYRRNDLDDPERVLADHRAGQLLAGDIALAQQPLAVGPVRPGELLGRVLMGLGDDEDADARAFGNRLDDIGPRQRMGFRGVLARHHHAFGNRHPGIGHRHLGDVLLHGERRGEHAGMAVGNLQDFQDALDGAVLAGPAVQHVEGDIGLEIREHRRDVAAHIEAGDPVAPAFQRRGAGRAGPQRYIAFGGPAPHENGDVLGGRHQVSPSMIRKSCRRFGRDHAQVQSMIRKLAGFGSCAASCWNT